MSRARVSASGKGRGGQNSGKACSLTPPSRPWDGGVGGPAPAARQSEGRMPDESEHWSKSMGTMTMNGTSGPHVDELQRALEAELVNSLRHQNAQLLDEVERLRNQRSQQGVSSTSSWSEIGDSAGKAMEKDDGGVRGRSGYRTPRSSHGNVRDSHGPRFTPDGTRVPDGTPPEGAPKPPSTGHDLPVVPPFPSSFMNDGDFEKFMDGYEKVDIKPKMLKSDETWEPSKELSPHETRAFWLETEVATLKQSLAKMTNGNPLRMNEYWLKGFHPPTGPPLFTGFPESPTDLGQPDPNLAECISKAHPGDCHGHLRGRCGVLPPQDRADVGEGEGQRQLLGGCGDGSLQDRAQRSTGGESSGMALTVFALMVGLCRALTVFVLMIGLCRAIMVFFLTIGPCAALLEFSNKIGLLEHRTYMMDSRDGRSCLDPRHGGGGGFGGLDPIPTSWESGGGISSSKADLPALPGSASPLQVWGLDPPVWSGDARPLKRGQPLVGFDCETSPGSDKPQGP